MGLFARLLNLVRGFFSAAVEDVERDNPEIVYQQAINDRIGQHQKLLSAVASIVTLRNKLQRDLQVKERELAEISAQIPVAVQSNDEQAALILIERKNALVPDIDEVKEELADVSKQAEDAKAALVTFQHEIEKLKGERDRMLAKREQARARIKIQEQLSGLSVQAETRALDAVRDSIHKLEAQADVTTEIQGAGMSDKLRRIRESTGSATAKAELEAIKRQMAAQPNVEKTL